jgi:hypothetical protein
MDTKKQSQQQPRNPLQSNNPGQKPETSTQKPNQAQPNKANPNAGKKPGSNW